MLFNSGLFKNSHNSLISEPFLESLPQVHLILLIVVTGIDGGIGGGAVGNHSWQTIITFTLSVFSACFGISKFFNVGPSRLIPYDEMNLGFFVLMMNIASCFIGKGFFLALVDFPPSGRTITIWSMLSLGPQIIFVSYL